VTNFELPRNLVEDFEDEAPDSARRTWLAGLKGVVADLVETWSLTDVRRPFQPGGASAWVAPVRTTDGLDAVLKVGWTHDEALHEADGLRFWAGDGTVLLYASRAEGATTALLLERCRPGTPLNETARPKRQGVVITEALRRLWREPPNDKLFRPLAEMCDAWADEYEDDAAEVEDVPDPGIVRAGMELLRNLPRTAQRNVVLGTDLHAGNILAAEREPWLVVDPKPYVGDPAYDPVQHMLNNPRRLMSDSDAFIDRIADLAGVDRERLAQWAFARCVSESIRSRPLREVAETMAAVI
jgi:streptomycin 6-kinase